MGNEVEIPKQNANEGFDEPTQNDDKKRAVLDNLDNLIEEITVDAYGDDEKLWAFRQAFEDHVTVPCEGFIIGEAVSLIEFA